MSVPAGPCVCCVSAHTCACVFVCVSGGLGTACLQVARSLGRTPRDSGPYPSPLQKHQWRLLFVFRLAGQ